jgi:hypothetical protein
VPLPDVALLGALGAAAPPLVLPDVLLPLPDVLLPLGAAVPPVAALSPA